MIIETSRQQNLGPFVAVFLITAMLVLLPNMIGRLDQTGEVGVSGGHANHNDTLTTPLPGNTCPNGCPWPDCGCGGKPVLTLQPTVFISPFPTFDPLITPDIPDPINNATAFPTLAVTGIPTGLPTPFPTADIWPTEVAPEIPTIEPSIQNVDEPGAF